jgi:hypothetical protein
MTGDHHKRRWTDGRAYRAWAWFDHLVTLVAVGLAVYAVFSVEGKADQAAVDAARAEQVAEAQREGRRTAIQVLCGGLRGVEEAGLGILTGTLPGAPPILGEGGPPSAEQRRQAEQWARAYNQVISRAIAREAGIAEASTVLDENGLIDCQELVRLSSAAAPGG